jgi:uncharacterized protein (DUF2236 family)
MTAVILPSPLQRRVEAAAGEFLRPAGLAAIDFSEPRGEPALFAPDSISWRVFKNPVVLFVGGVAAVILELAEPRVRAGVWNHTSFRSAPVTRMQRTGMAAMVTVYAARSKAQEMIAAINERHRKVSGRTEAGEAYAADDPELLGWVHATAAFGFSEAHDRFVRPFGDAERDRLWAESAPSARLYGVEGAPASHAEWEDQLAAMSTRLGVSPVLAEFLHIMRHAPLLPAPARPLQRLLIRAAISLTPGIVMASLGLEREAALSPLQAALVRAAAQAADRLVLRNAPPSQACERLGLPADWLYRR